VEAARAELALRLQNAVVASATTDASDASPVSASVANVEGPGDVDSLPGEGAALPTVGDRICEQQARGKEVEE